jgi:DNA-binding MarR family transcriptional regulator
MSKSTGEPAALAGRLRIVLGQAVRRLREQSRKGELTLSQIAALGRLEREGPQTVTTLARAEGVKSQSMGATVAALESLELVVGSPDPEDGRQTLLALTPKARSLILQNRAAKDDLLQGRLAERLTADEQRELSRALALIERLIEP